MIIKPVDNFNITPILKAPMGEIRLPGLIRLHRLKSGDVCLGSLLGLGSNKSCRAKDAPDG